MTRTWMFRDEPLRVFTQHEDFAARVRRMQLIAQVPDQARAAGPAPSIYRLEGEFDLLSDVPAVSAVLSGVSVWLSLPVLNNLWPATVWPATVWLDHWPVLAFRSNGSLLVPPHGTDITKVVAFERVGPSPAYHDWCLEIGWAERAGEIARRLEQREVWLDRL